MDIQSIYNLDEHSKNKILKKQHCKKQVILKIYYILFNSKKIVISNGWYLVMEPTEGHDADGIFTTGIMNILVD